jgi:hypothetical protein
MSSFAKTLPVLDSLASDQKLPLTRLNQYDGYLEAELKKLIPAGDPPGLPPIPWPRGYHYPKGFIQNGMGGSAFYRGSGALYAFLVMDQGSLSRYTLYQDQTPLLTMDLEYGAEGPVLEAFTHDGQAGFVVATTEPSATGSIRSTRLETIIGRDRIAAKYGYDEAFSPFWFRGRLGFLARRGKQSFLVYDGRIITPPLEGTVPYACCCTPDLPLAVGERTGHTYVRFLATESGTLQVLDVPLQ